MPTVGPIWQSQACDEEAALRLAAALNIEPPVARLLCQRGLGDPELALRFLNPSPEHLHDPHVTKPHRIVQVLEGGIEEAKGELGEGGGARGGERGDKRSGAEGGCEEAG